MSSTLRLPYATLASDAYAAMLALNQAFKRGPLPLPLIDLVLLRVSQINGCAYCVDLHWRDLINQDQDPRKLNALTVWRECPFFDRSERAALDWAERVTQSAGQTCSDAAFADLASCFSAAEIAQLGFAIAGMNAWNRLAIPFRQVVPT